MEQKELVTLVRDKKGKQANKALRKSGLIPAVVYGQDEESQALSCDAKNLEAILHSSVRENVVLKLRIKSDLKSKEEKAETVIIKEVQHDPIKGDILHVDFNHISLDKKIKVKVPLETKGEAAGIKMGGLIEHVLWELEVECLPISIPEKIVVNVSKLELGDALHVKDITAPEGVQILNDPEQVAITVEAPKEEVVAEPVPGEEMKEPEVLKQKSPEEIEAEEKAKKAEKEK